MIALKRLIILNKLLNRSLFSFGTLYRRTIDFQDRMSHNGTDKIKTGNKTSEMNDLLTWPQVVLFGDSLTQYAFSHEGCWGSLLADSLQRRCDVLSRGFSGYNSQWSHLILPQIVNASNSKDVAAFVIFLGANDSCKPDLNPQQHVPVEEYKLCLIKMVEYLQSVGIKRDKVILLAPPTCDETAWAVQCNMKGKPMSKCNKLTGTYAKAAVEAAEESGVQCVDLYSNMMKQENWPGLLNDGLHFSTEGSKFVYKLLWPAIEKRTSHLPTILPLWDQVNNDSPQVALLPDRK